MVVVNIEEMIQDLAFQLGIDCVEGESNWQILKWYLEMAYDEGWVNGVNLKGEK